MWELVDTIGDAQLKIKDLQMKDRADEFVHEFRLLAIETGYGDQVLIKIFREGLLLSLAKKIMDRLEEKPETLKRWYKAAIRYDNQWKMTEAAVEKWRIKRGKTELKKPKII
ncbi:hypothetical protein Moror_15470 [Moniliophthora roreri MCA 2997]|uniref:Retrotransposon gag domain-containing protein n=2 Tax=Moniliophthora roreri TaxID=221103 RepID=V2XS84_MONRO|nr:hypothetical protein Moror_15470 [Moniliophthora roreri MCA 2997]